MKFMIALQSTFKSGVGGRMPMRHPVMYFAMLHLFGPAHALRTVAHLVKLFLQAAVSAVASSRSDKHVLGTLDLPPLGFRSVR